MLPTNNELLTVEEAAAFLKVPKSWIYDRTRMGTLPVRKLGGHLRFPARELAEWVDQQRIGHKVKAESA